MFPSTPPPVQNHHIPPRSLGVTFHMTYTALSARLLFGTMGLHVVIKSHEQSCCKIKGNLPPYTHMSCIKAPFLGQRTQQRTRRSKTISFLLILEELGGYRELGLLLDVFLNPKRRATHPHWSQVMQKSTIKNTAALTHSWSWDVMNPRK